MSFLPQQPSPLFFTNPLYLVYINIWHPLQNPDSNCCAFYQTQVRSLPSLSVPEALTGCCSSWDLTNVILACEDSCQKNQMLNFGPNFEAEVWSPFWSWSLYKILKLKSVVPLAMFQQCLWCGIVAGALVTIGDPACQGSIRIPADDYILSILQLAK